MSQNAETRQRHRREAEQLAAVKPHVQVIPVTARKATLVMPDGRTFTGSYGDVCSVLRCDDDTAMSARLDAIERRIAMRPERRQSAGGPPRTNLSSFSTEARPRRRRKSAASSDGCDTATAVVAAAVFFGG